MPLGSAALRDTWRKGIMGHRLALPVADGQPVEPSGGEAVES
jgi:hypothetical protein